jgi:hypothetical protein
VASLPRRPHQRQGEVERGHLLGDQRGEDPVRLAGLNRFPQRGQQALPVLVADCLRRRHRHPRGGDPRLAEHALDPAAAGIGHD